MGGFGPEAEVTISEPISEDGGFVDGLNVIENAENDGVVYNMQGIRVQQANKGVYIINGKKVIK
jgi:hypothetical protein